MKIKSLLMRFLKEPLGHFLIIGFGLFLFFDAGASQNNDGVIVVDRDRLVTFMQYRAKEFNQQKYGRILDNLPTDIRQGLITEYIREEALYREAKALRLDQNDSVARRRLIQQLENMTRSFIVANVSLSDDDLQNFLDQNQVNYEIADKITFTHIFIKSDEQAVALLNNLHKTHVAFHQATAYGDRFLYKRNYVRKDAEEIASHFGQDMQKQLFDLKPNDKMWQGPFRSEHGSHLVMITRHSVGYVPALADIRQRVQQDAIHSLIQIKLDKAMSLIVEQYDVERVMGEK